MNRSIEINTRSGQIPKQSNLAQQSKNSVSNMYEILFWDGPSSSSAVSLGNNTFREGIQDLYVIAYSAGEPNRTCVHFTTAGAATVAAAAAALRP